MNTVGGNIELKEIGLVISTNGLHHNTEINSSGNLQLTMIDENKFNVEGYWISDVVDLGDKFADFEKVFVTDVQNLGSSYSIHTRTSDDGVTFDEWLTVAMDGTIISETKQFIQVRINLFAGYSDETIQFADLNDDNSISELSPNDMIEINNGLKLKTDYTFEMDIEGDKASQFIDMSKFKRIDMLEVDPNNKTIFKTDNGDYKWQNGVEQVISRNDYVPTLTSNTSSSLVTVETESYLATYNNQGFKVFNDTNVDLQDCWQPDNSTIRTETWLKVVSSEKVMIGGYSITNRNSTIRSDPKKWIVEGSDDGLSWESLHSVDNESNWNVNQKKSYVYINTKSFFQHRFRFLDSTKLNGANNLVHIGQIELFQVLNPYKQHGWIQESDVNNGSSDLIPERMLTTFNTPMQSANDILPPNANGQLFSTELNFDSNENLIGLNESSQKSTNLALNKIAIVSSVYEDASGTAYANAITNGSITSGGYNGFWSPNNNDRNPFAIVNLGAIQSVNRVRLYIQNCKRATISVSTDNTNYGIIHDGDLVNGWNVFDFKTVKAQYVRVNNIPYTPNVNGFLNCAINELEVYCNNGLIFNNDNKAYTIQEGVLVETSEEDVSTILDRTTINTDLSKQFNKKNYIINADGQSNVYEKFINRSPTSISCDYKMAFLIDSKYYTVINGGELLEISQSEISVNGFNSLTITQSILSVVGDTFTVAVYSDVVGEIVIRTDVEDFTIQDELGESTQLLYYDPTGTQTSANLSISRNWSPFDELVGNIEVEVLLSDMQEQQELHIKAIPKAQTIHTQLVQDLKDITKINSVDNGNSRYLISPDLVNWYRFTNGVFEIVDESSIDTLGMKSTELSSISALNLQLWEYDSIGVSAYIPNEESLITLLDYTTSLPTTTHEIEATSFYILNTTARIDVMLEDTLLTAYLSDDDLTRIKYRVLLNGQPYRQSNTNEDGWTELAEPPKNILMDLYDESIVNVNNYNIVRIEFQDYWGSLDYWEAQFYVKKKKKGYSYAFIIHH